ncbi:uncharacterized protein LOC132193956 [Neocloeon triangulifer]|uniref:uncharacterized protein LOC132193956 n=1 Tax=Neocloeon triangulifer TaxID=2078957 RepID=UPI00286EC62E|nr:uncharacterized protein LOC132193956 [Neocloeon triangulifer]
MSTDDTLSSPHSTNVFRRTNIASPASLKPGQFLIAPACPEAMPKTRKQQPDDSSSEEEEPDQAKKLEAKVAKLVAQMQELKAGKKPSKGKADSAGAAQKDKAKKGVVQLSSDEDETKASSRRERNAPIEDKLYYITEGETLEYLQRVLSRFDLQTGFTLEEVQQEMLLKLEKWFQLDKVAGAKKASDQVKAPPAKSTGKK